MMTNGIENNASLNNLTTDEAALAQAIGDPGWGVLAEPLPDGHGQALGTVDEGSIDGYWIGESDHGVRRAFDPDRSAYTSVPAISPDPGTTAANGESVVFVNGLLNNQGASANAGQLIANKTGADVRVFYNASQGLNDPLRAVGDNINLLGVSRTPAAENLANSIFHSALDGQDFHIQSTSHGSILTRNAILIARERLQEHFGYESISFPGFAATVDPAGYQAQVAENSRAVSQAHDALGNIKIETFGSGASAWPDGPKYVHWVNTNDTVAWSVGVNHGGLAPRIDIGNLGIAPGNDAVIIRFEAASPGLTDAHYMETYLPKRQLIDSFDQVYNQFAPTNDANSYNIVTINGQGHFID